MATKKKAEAKKEARPAPAKDPEKSEAMAKMALRPSVNAAAVVVSYGKPLGLEQEDVAALVERLSDDVKDVWAGDMKRAEAMLFGQAHALQSIFMELARRATGQQYLNHWEAHLRMALKAQNQCRMTLETLATIKNPPVVFARQANINNGGQQQVNNDESRNRTGSGSGAARAHAANTHVAQSELLEATDEQWLDTGTPRAASGTDPELETVGAIHRPANSGR